MTVDVIMLEVSMSSLVTIYSCLGEISLYSLMSSFRRFLFVALNTNLNTIMLLLNLEYRYINHLMWTSTMIVKYLWNSQWENIGVNIWFNVSYWMGLSFIFIILLIYFILYNLYIVASLILKIISVVSRHVSSVYILSTTAI